MARGTVYRARCVSAHWWWWWWWWWWWLSPAYELQFKPVDYVISRQRKLIKASRAGPASFWEGPVAVKSMDQNAAAQGCFGVSSKNISQTEYKIIWWSSISHQLSNLRTKTVEPFFLYFEIGKGWLGPLGTEQFVHHAGHVLPVNFPPYTIAPKARYFAVKWTLYEQTQLHSFYLIRRMWDTFT